MSAYEIGLMETGEEAKVAALFETVFHRRMSALEWDWKYRENPHGSGVCMVIRKDDTIIGFYGLIPRRFQIQTSVYTGFQETDLMIHPNERGRTFFQELGLAAYEHLKQHGYLFTFGFPNQVSTPVGVKKLKWILVCPMPIWNRYLHITYILNRTKLRVIAPAADAVWQAANQCSEAARRVTSPYSIKVSESFPLDTYEALWEECIQYYPIIAVRDAAYMNWRYRALGNRSYLFIEVRESDRLAGVAVLRILNNNQREAWITELLSYAETAIQRALLNSIISVCRQNNVDVIRGWCLDGSGLTYPFRQMGFALRPTSIHHVIRLLTSAHLNNHLVNADNWFVSIGDSDCV